MSTLKVGNNYVEPPACLVDFLKQNWKPGPGMLAGMYDHNQMQSSFVNNTIQRFVRSIDVMSPNQRATYLNQLIEKRNIISPEMYGYDPQDVKRNIIESFWGEFGLQSPLYGQNMLSQDAVTRTLAGMECCIRVIRQLYPDLIQPGPDMGPPEPGPDIGGSKTKKRKHRKNKRRKNKTRKTKSRKSTNTKKIKRKQYIKIKGGNGDKVDCCIYSK
jgi:hypothetical protein